MNSEKNEKVERNADQNLGPESSRRLAQCCSADELGAADGALSFAKTDVKKEGDQRTEK